MQTEIIAVETCRKCIFAVANKPRLAYCAHPKFKGESDTTQRIITYGKGFNRLCPLAGKKFKQTLSDPFRVRVVYRRVDEEKLFKKRFSSFSTDRYGTYTKCAV